MLKVAVFSDTHERASDWIDAVQHFDFLFPRGINSLYTA